MRGGIDDSLALTTLAPVPRFGEGVPRHSSSFAETIRVWQKRLPPEEARARIADLITVAWADPRGISVDDVLAWVARVEALPKPVPTPRPTPAPTPKRRRRRRRLLEPAPTPHPHPTLPAPAGCRGRPSKRAQALVREQLAHGPKPGDEIQAAAEAAEIPERSLIAAASALGVRCRRGQWWLPA